MGYRYEHVNLNINVLSSQVYDQLKAHGQLLSTAFYVVDAGKDVRDLYLGESKIADSTVKDFVNSSIENAAAYYVTLGGRTFTTYAQLSSAPLTALRAGDRQCTALSGPNKNDYCYVLSDETHSNATTRYRFVSLSSSSSTYAPVRDWTYMYNVNSTPFTAAQWASINSGVTSKTQALRFTFEDGSSTTLSVFCR